MSDQKKKDEKECDCGCNCHGSQFHGKGMMHCCKVEALINVDERGQTVLPKELRDKIGIKAGEKLAVINVGKMAHGTCIVLIKAEELEGKLKDMFGPLVEK